MAKPKPFVAENYKGLQIDIVGTLSKTYLVVDGVIQDSYTGVMTSSVQLKCTVSDVVILADIKLQVCGFTVYLYCDNELITKKWHL